MTSNATSSARHEPRTADASLYPDLVSAGSFAGALEAVAADLGLSRDCMKFGVSDSWKMHL
ncbi:hypothetical protein GTY86_35210 [Streptomyces sp. SID5770]|uniref:hypothetical protein n=1 Tax=Streptomyces sp. SID5770 TaxID=2690308 RepID=UPI00136BE11A|nr:hypothetical protein [Streptomyces sp. SID5770]MZE56428.1 hypothetical protein [Streptomyces sp. SID5770]